MLPRLLAQVAYKLVMDATSSIRLRVVQTCDGYFAEDEDEEEEEADFVELKKIPARPTHKLNLPDMEVCKFDTPIPRVARFASFKRFPCRPF
jgi:hypothetical protein